MASRELAVATLLLIGALLLVMAIPVAVSEEDAASGQQFPSSVDPALKPSPKKSRAVRAGSPVVTSLADALPSPAPASAPTGSATVPPQTPAPAPQPRESSCLPSSVCCDHADY